MTAESAQSLPDLYNPAFTADPFPAYRELRERAPVHRAQYPGGMEIWLVTRHADAQVVLADPRFSSSTDTSSSPIFASGESDEAQRGLDRNLLNLDPPDHTRLRRLVTREFTAARVAALRPQVEEHVAELLDAIAPAGHADLVGQFATPLPTGVAGQILGVPAADWETFRGMSNRLVTPDFDMTPDDFDILKRRIRAFVAGLVERKRVEPGDDLVTWLTAGCDADPDLTDDDLIGVVFTLLVGSHETTTNFVGNAALALVQHPEQLRLLREQPVLLPGAVQELLRYDGPFEASSLRFAVTDVELNGVTIPKGATVAAVISSANRDPQVYEEPDRLDITRPHADNLSFGRGAHFCPGRSLSLLEAEVAIGAMVARLPDLRLAEPATLRWRAGMFFRGLHELPVAFTAS
jgi:cytochrome P450